MTDFAVAVLCASGIIFLVQAVQGSGRSASKTRCHNILAEKAAGQKVNNDCRVAGLCLHQVADRRAADAVLGQRPKAPQSWAWRGEAAQVTVKPEIVTLAYLTPLLAELGVSAMQGPDLVRHAGSADKVQHTAVLL